MQNHRLICMCLDMFLEILRPLERLPTEIAFVRLEGNVDADVGGDVVAFHRCCPAVTPLAYQIEVICALAPNMPLADVVL